MYVCMHTYHARVSYFNFIHYILHVSVLYTVFCLNIRQAQACLLSKILSKTAMSVSLIVEKAENEFTLQAPFSCILLVLVRIAGTTWS